MHIVVLCGSYAPNYSAVGICAKNIVDELLNLKHEVTVLAEKSRFPISIATSEKIVPVTSEIHNYLIHDDRIDTLKYRIIRYLQALFNKENVKYDMVSSYLQALCSLNDRKQIDLIVPFCFPIEGCIAAVRFRQTHHSVKLIPYIFDRYASSSSAHRLKLNKMLKFKRHLMIESDIFSQSYKILSLPSWESHIIRYHNAYRNKFVSCEHPLINPIDVSVNLKFNHSKINVVYTGSILRHVRNPKYCLAVIDSLLSLTNQFVFHFYSLGDCQNELNKYCNKYPENIMSYGSVSSKEAHSAIQQADILMSIGNNDVSQFASKNFEYISTGNPVIHFSKDSEDPVNRILNHYGNALILDEKDSISNSVAAINTFIKRGLPQLSFAEVSEIFEIATPQYIVQQLLSSIV